MIQGPKETHESYFLAHLTNRYLEQRAQDGEPFCLRVDPWGPHQPYYVAPPFARTVDPQKIAPPPNFAQDYSDRPAHQRWCLDEILKGATTKTWPQGAPVVARCYEHIARVDSALLTILDTLDRLNLSENTLVIYSADHGDLLAAQGGGFDKGWILVEETMRIPLAVCGPNVASGAQNEALVSNLDIVATVRDIAGSNWIVEIGLEEHVSPA